MTQGWQNEAADGLKVGWSYVFQSDYNDLSRHLVGHPTTEGCRAV